MRNKQKITWPPIRLMDRIKILFGKKCYANIIIKTGKDNSILRVEVTCFPFIEHTIQTIREDSIFLPVKTTILEHND